MNREHARSKRIMRNMKFHSMSNSKEKCIFGMRSVGCTSPFLASVRYPLCHGTVGHLSLERFPKESLIFFSFENMNMSGNWTPTQSRF